MNPEKMQTPPAPPIAPPESERPSLDVATPAKWQMKIRLYLETLSPSEADAWIGDLRLITAMAGRIVRDEVYKRVTARCFVCDRPFRDGRPACEAGYYDPDREFIKVYSCDQSEFPRLLEMVKKKEDEIAAAEERAEKAARQAAKDARSKVLTRQARA
jgi:hypothetical protein